MVGYLPIGPELADMYVIQTPSLTIRRRLGAFAGTSLIPGLFIMQDMAVVWRWTVEIVLFLPNQTLNSGSKRSCGCLMILL